ncbi:hypothetical protein AD943_00155 [Gluconobacter roseus]|nr:hypothetical protein AD943_00155 [Gluconobacter roseus]
MDQNLLTETVAVIAPVGQHGLGVGVGNPQHHQGFRGFVIRDPASGKDKAERTSLIVISDMVLEGLKNRWLMRLSCGLRFLLC